MTEVFQRACFKVFVDRTQPVGLFFCSCGRWAIPIYRRGKLAEGVPVVHMDRGASLWVPRINDERVRTKPPLFYWAGLVASKVLGGVSEISLRLPSVFAGTATVFLTTLLGFRLFSPVTGCLAGLILATSWRYAYLASHARIDMLFAFFTYPGVCGVLEND